MGFWRCGDARSYFLASVARLAMVLILTISPCRPCGARDWSQYPFPASWIARAQILASASLDFAAAFSVDVPIRPIPQEVSSVRSDGYVGIRLFAPCSCCFLATQRYCVTHSTSLSLAFSPCTQPSDRRESCLLGNPSTTNAHPLAPTECLLS